MPFIVTIRPLNDVGDALSIKDLEKFNADCLTSFWKILNSVAFDERNLGQIKSRSLENSYFLSSVGFCLPLAS